jgi:hypothetical protein
VEPIIELRYERGEWGATELQTTLDEILAELTDPTSEAAEAARSAGLDPTALSSAAVRVREPEHGLEPFTTILVGVAVNLGTSAAVALWREVLWPALSARRGDDALGEPVTETGDDLVGG